MLGCFTAERVVKAPPVGDGTRGSSNEPPRQSTITVKDKIPLIIKASLKGDVTPDTAAGQSVNERSRSRCVRFSSRRVKGQIPLNTP